MSSEIEKNHASQYEQERQARWGMADNGEEIAIKKICDLFSTILDISRDNVKYVRLDEIWFKKYNIEEIENEWVKGVSDFVIQITISKEQYILVEIKLKSQEYRKTSTGGTTRNGSLVSNYGCNSYYLDVIPVHKNMNNFVSKTNNNFSAFIIAFVKEDFSEINIISLAKINKMIKDGWEKNGEKINIYIFGEGYGQNAYLIPKDATTDGNDISKQELERILMDDYPRP